MPVKLGQNFLKDENVVEKIIKAADLKSDDVVLEVGPGKGVLTNELAKFSNRVIAVEKDEELVKMTAGNFQFSIFPPKADQPGAGNFQSISNDLSLNFKNNVVIISGDILEINLDKLLEANNVVNYKVVANIPYYITSKIIRLFLESENPPSEMILMVQKEVAERIVANPGQMSILAVSVQYYAKAEYLFTVGRESFDPAPEVDSAVIKISGIRNQEAGSRNNEEVKKFFRIVKAGFSAKRKTLANNLSNSLHKDKKEIESILSQLGFLSTVRAQELSVEDWKKLSNIFNIG
ncbi:MAG: dimethyladenosine transferase [Candidatus Moranbacteria bacterium GW2011_GWE2_35_2-]|nr:MAG: dimethyladenosine transferase [Candidatus Moranbacteria bacterium GW2011_GWE2_35_2-]KKQ22497.1 MAG: dimethyladenosine transferase [Candidatus Moranbacteria bacterium GW2011_GWF2_37_11]KKQ29566.1 MAG: dimethyladenosine transferase [Candidatus Moranbacteria bacterium GW2011_GWD1_37_17]KKQ30563.1 MAG: dimethyladenosine transferase [Candidatus Moranbacteria bacterium GW2011_GWE1_37_24]KKQ48212.1 MAG: dimethyladenosine transferase [Candidatus Moranbacteria bacterium GW2011_GWD2_37_9]